ncbi:MAG: hypothetical protein QXR82_03110 [Candidatus Bathyarchaeia archaeon]|nr:hypothetical protein [Candidatus Bathyarchaeota archaeon]
MKLSIWIFPRLKKASLQLSKSLKSFFTDLILLPFPKSLTTLLKDLINGAPYKLFLKKIEEEKIFHSVNVFDYFYGEILKACKELKRINPKIEFTCYKEDENMLFQLQSAVKFSILTFKVASTGKIDLNEWIIALTENLRKVNEYLNRELNFIEQQIKHYSNILCLAGFEGKYYFQHLQRKFPVEIRYFALPYHFTPLEILSANLTIQKKLDFEKLIQLIKSHIDYIRNYVLKCNNLDEAYEKWVNDNANWINFWRKF